MGKGEMKTINQWVEDIHENALAHGWWENKRPFPEIVALCHSEISEAMESFRNGEALVYIKDGKPEGQAVELCDAVIRVLDWFGSEGLDMEHVMRLKHEYNKTREYRHGGKIA